MQAVTRLTAQRRLRRYSDALKQRLPMLRRHFHIQYLGLFGSYVQGTPRRHSDLDILVDFSKTPSLFEFMELEDCLSDLLGIKVDLVMKGTLKPQIDRRILDEVVGL